MVSVGQDIEEYTQTVLSYISFCTGNGVRLLIRGRVSAFRAGDKEQYASARAKLKMGIRAAKERYKKIEGLLKHSNPWQVWQGI